MILLRKAAASSMYPVARTRTRRAEALQKFTGWQRLITHGTYGLISAERGEHSKGVNQQRTHDLYSHLTAQGHHPVPAHGVYRGSSKESSFMVPHKDPHELHQHLHKMAEKYNQESYIVRHNGQHHMVFPKGTSEHPYPHYLSGSQITHHLTPHDDRTVLHPSKGHSKPFRLEGMFDHAPKEGEPSYKSEARRHHREHHVVLHAPGGPHRFTMHFDPAPHQLKELNLK